MPDTSPYLLASICEAYVHFAAVKEGQIVVDKLYLSAAHETLGHAIGAFLNESTCRQFRFQKAAIVVAGDAGQPFLNTVEMRQEISAALNIPRVCFLEECEALAWSLPDLTRDDLQVLSLADSGVGGVKLVIDSGTELRMAAYRPGKGVDTDALAEAGDLPYAPANDDEARIVARVWGALPSPSAENLNVKARDLLTEHGLINIHRAIASGQSGAQHGNLAAKQALRIYAGMLGHFAAGQALKFKATGGVYLTGKMFDKLDETFPYPTFCERFADQSGDPASVRLLHDTSIYRITKMTPPFAGLLRYLHHQETAKQSPRKIFGHGAPFLALH
jgi:glucokinase